MESSARVVTDTSGIRNDDHDVCFSKFASSIQTPALRRVTLKVNAVQGINLGQGTCQLPVPEVVQEAAIEAIRSGYNRYTAARGLPSIREAISKKLQRDNGFSSLNPETEVIATNGATGAFEALCAGFVNVSDKVAIIEPYYPYHITTLEKYSASIIRIKLNLLDWSIDFDELEIALKKNPKFLVITNPGNPHGKVYSKEELIQIGRLCNKYGTYLISDETYEYITYDNRPHISPGSLSELRERTFTVGSYSKTFSITGWRVGYLVTPPHYSDKLVAMHDLTYVCTPSAFQEAIARSIEVLPVSFYDELKTKYAKKRELLRKALEGAGLTPKIPQGAYYMIADFSERFPHFSSFEFIDHMISAVGIGAVPSDDFTETPKDHKWVRFCYAVEDSVLMSAAEKISRL